MKTVQEEIAELKKQIYNDQQKLTKLLSIPALSRYQAIADYMHSKMCRHNHADGCSWYYAIKDGVHNWNDYAHKEYLHKAQLLINHFDGWSSISTTSSSSDEKIKKTIDIITGTR